MDAIQVDPKLTRKLKLSEAAGDKKLIRITHFLDKD